MKKEIKKKNNINEKIKKNYFGKANSLIEDLNDEIETSENIDDKYEMDNEGDVAIETAKSILFAYIDRCIEEGVKELGEDYGLGDVDGYDIVQNEIERIAKPLKNYLKSIQ